MNAETVTSGITFCLSGVEALLALIAIASLLVGATRFAYLLGRDHGRRDQD